MQLLVRKQQYPLRRRREFRLQDIGKFHISTLRAAAQALEGRPDIPSDGRVISCCCCCSMIPCTAWRVHSVGNFSHRLTVRVSSSAVSEDTTVDTYMWREERKKAATQMRGFSNTHEDGRNSQVTINSEFSSQTQCLTKPRLPYTQQSVDATARPPASNARACVRLHETAAADAQVGRCCCEPVGQVSDG